VTFLESSVRNIDNTVLSSSASAQALVERRMEFVTAHPDAKVEFHYGPKKGRTSAVHTGSRLEHGVVTCGIPAPVKQTHGSRGPNTFGGPGGVENNRHAGHLNVYRVRSAC
jgi:hypothetical protein